MSDTVFNLSNIRKYFHGGYDIIFPKIEETLNDPDLQELSGKGKKVQYESQEGIAQMGWHKDSAGHINGVFVLVYNKDTFQIWKAINNDDFKQPYALTVTQIHTTPEIAQWGLTVNQYEDIFKRCIATSHTADVEYTISAEHLKDPQAIKKFCGDNPLMLPPSIRDHFFPKKKSGNFVNRPDRIYVYITAFFLVAVTVKFAEKLFKKTPPPKQPPQLELDHKS